MTNATTTRGKAAETVAPSTRKRTRVVELPKNWGPVLTELQEIRSLKAEITAREKEITDHLKQAAGMNADRNETLAVKIAGIVRARISLRGRTNIDRDVLRDSFPEAWEAATSEGESQVVTTA